MLQLSGLKKSTSYFVAYRRTNRACKYIGNINLLITSEHGNLLSLLES
jgi:hypothetical protein